MRIAYLSIILVAACGGDPGDDAGTGSNTLRVEADVEATPDIENAVAAIDFTTELHVDVEKNGVPVTTGEVVLVSDGGEVALTWDPSDGDNGRWRGAQSGYFEVYELHVTSGDDYVHGVRLDGPDIHVFTSPDGSTAVDATLPLLVTWSRDDEAETARLETDAMDPVAVPDTGSFELPVGSLKSSPDQTEDEELRIERRSRIVPAGAVAGSELRVRIENRLPLVVAATGL